MKLEEMPVGGTIYLHGKYPHHVIAIGEEKFFGRDLNDNYQFGLRDEGSWFPECFELEKRSDD